MYRHIIPVNISADGNFFGGMIKKRNAIEASLIFLAGFLFFKAFLFAVPIMVKTALFVVLVLLPTVIALIGINNQSVIELLLLYISFKRKPEIYPYNIQTESPPDTDETFITRMSAKRKAKKDAKAAKKAAKQQLKSNKKAGKQQKKANKKATKRAKKRK